MLLTICIEKCPPCHRLYPVLEAVAGWYAAAEEKGGEKDKKTTIATSLYDKNDIVLRRIRAFPTIVLLPAKEVSYCSVCTKSA